MSASPNPSDLYRLVGEMDGCRKLSATFYGRVASDPLLSPLFPSLHCAVEALDVFLAQILGGPCEHSRRSWWLSLHESHLRFQIGQPERDAWMNNMLKALDDVRLEEPSRGALVRFFEQSSTYLMNRQDRTGPAASAIHPDIAPPWDAQLVLDEVVAAVRKGDATRVMDLVERPDLQSWFTRDRAAFVSLLALFSGTSHDDLLAYVRKALLANPELVREGYSNGRTLLHGAAEAGNQAVVELLLSLGADPNSTQGGHTPLYCLGNACTAPTGPDVVRLLVQAGANVNTQSGVKKCAALHMAARRGNVSIAAALLDCAANIEARDSMGDTPLRRAVNCAKPEMVAFLLSRGADIHAVGSKGLTPVQAARGPRLKVILQDHAKK